MSSDWRMEGGSIVGGSTSRNTDRSAAPPVTKLSFYFVCFSLVSGSQAQVPGHLGSILPKRTAVGWRWMDLLLGVMT